MQNNIFKDMMVKAEKKDEKRNKEVKGFFSDDSKTKTIGIITLGLLGLGAYALYRMDKSDTHYSRV